VGDEEDKEKMQELYEVDTMDRVVNTAPMGLPEGVLDTQSDMVRYGRHLTHF